MKRDWKLIRRILTALESEAVMNGDIRQDSIEGYSTDVVCYHIKLLANAGMIDAEISQTIGSSYAIARSLTWQGHELMDSIRTDALWNRIVLKIQKAGLELSFVAIKTATAGIIRELLST